MTAPVHYVAWAQQPDIQIYCDNAWTTPGWGEPLDVLGGEGPVWVTDETPARSYTFDEECVTCPQCLTKMQAQP
jgi:hypothetical protein